MEICPAPSNRPQTAQPPGGLLTRCSSFKNLTEKRRPVTINFICLLSWAMVPRQWSNLLHACLGMRRTFKPADCVKPTALCCVVGLSQSVQGLSRPACPPAALNSAADSLQAWVTWSPRPLLRAYLTDCGLGSLHNHVSLCTRILWVPFLWQTLTYTPSPRMSQGHVQEVLWIKRMDQDFPLLSESAGSWSGHKIRRVSEDRRL